MSRRRWFAGGTVLFLLAASVSVAVGAPGAKAAPLDLEVALRTNGKCGTWAQRLGPIAVVTGLQPGVATSPVEICLRNKGSATGTLFGSVVDRVDVEIACTGDEPSVDQTCVPGAMGELGSVLLIVGALRPGCSGAAGTALSASFNEAAIPIRLGELKKNAETCVQLRLDYPSTTPALATLAAQTDRLTWRYAFDLSN